jgi:hypothetical protein
MALLPINSEAVWSWRRLDRRACGTSPSHLISSRARSLLPPAPLSSASFSIPLARLHLALSRPYSELLDAAAD